MVYNQKAQLNSVFYALQRQISWLGLAWVQTCNSKYFKTPHQPNAALSRPPLKSGPAGWRRCDWCAIAWRSQRAALTCWPVPSLQWAAACRLLPGTDTLHKCPLKKAKGRKREILKHPEADVLVSQFGWMATHLMHHMSLNPSQFERVFEFFYRLVLSENNSEYMQNNVTRLPQCSETIPPHKIRKDENSRKQKE